jgi:hypothetical protein
MAIDAENTPGGHRWQPLAGLSPDDLEAASAELPALANTWGTES